METTYSSPQTLCGMTLQATPPFIHHALTYGLDVSVQVIDWKWYDPMPYIICVLTCRLVFASFPLYLGGAFIYVKRIPECWFPGMFDIWVRVIRPHCMC